MKGYLHPLYAQSFSAIGTPIFLPKSKSWLIKRQIPGTPYFDAMGPYPLFTCENWNRLNEDIESLDDQLVSLSLVTDPFLNIKYESLKKIFPICYPFKDHFITDFSQPLEFSVTKRTRKHARIALKEIHVEHCPNPIRHLEAWTLLYDELISRHDITGIRKFSKQSFNHLLNVEGAEIFIARLGDEIVGAEIFIINNDIGYAHLAALNQVGYQNNASYALDWTALQYFSNFLRFLDHGAGSGIDDSDDGLTQYKSRWASKTLPVYFCGRILNSDFYNEILEEKDVSDTNYFPAYRQGEFK